MTYRHAAPRFDGKDAERRSWMLGHLQHYEKHRPEIEAREAGRDWWLEGDRRWRAA